MIKRLLDLPGHARIAKKLPNKNMRPIFIHICPNVVLPVVAPPACLDTTEPRSVNDTIFFNHYPSFEYFSEVTDKNQGLGTVFTVTLEPFKKIFNCITFYIHQFTLLFK